MGQLADRFITALRSLEDSGDTAPLIDLFADDCELTNVAAGDERRGKDGAHRFWEEDRSLFRDVRSEFHNVLEEDGRAALEWTRTGVGVGGDDLEYAGATFIETADGRIRRLMAYFHPRDLGRQAI
jgi:steroid delta-isomerase-like uncharacterized protein